MSEIELLDQVTIDKIAAGEVVERPSSIVKELVENAIDARATAINVEIKEGGIGFIRITDNGIGIEKSQIRKAFLRHSTSKIRKVEDLLNIQSLGFRGEALSSIAAVSQVELITKTNDSLTGVRYIIEGGAEKAFEEIGAPGGTTFIIRNVFYNTPARKKFLKSPTTEGSYIASLMEKLCISHPEISFNFIQNGKVRLHTTGNGSLKDIIYAIYGKDITANLIKTEFENDEIKIKGFVCKPAITRGNKAYENYFVNGRYVKNSIISRSIEDAFKPFIMQHRYPFTMILVEVPGESVDINVHPSKQEVRFANGEYVYNQIYKAIYDGLTHKDIIPEINFDRPEKKPLESAFVKEKAIEPFEFNRRIDESLLKDSPDHKEEDIVRDNISPYDFIKREEDKGLFQQEKAADREKSAILSKRPTVVDVQQISLDIQDDNALKKDIKIIGQVFETYWIIEYDSKMYIIDQHAAHEKVLYERIMKNLKNRNHSSQVISPPVVITLSQMEEDVLNNYQDTFAGLGFEISNFGGSEYVISAVPFNIFNINYQDMFIELLDNLSQGIQGDKPDILLDKIATMSCKAAIKGNMHISVNEAEELIREMFELDNPYNCPHGRPTVISMSKYEMEKKFKRIL